MPSIWPLIKRCSRPSPSTEKTWNLTLDDPALTTRIVSMASRCGRRRAAAPGIGIEGRHRTGGKSGAQRIRARRQDDRYARAEHDAGAIGPGEIGEVLGQHVAGLEIRHDEDLGAA